MIFKIIENSMYIISIFIGHSNANRTLCVIKSAIASRQFHNEGLVAWCLLNMRISMDKRRKNHHIIIYSRYMYINDSYNIDHHSPLYLKVNSLVRRSVFDWNHIQVVQTSFSSICYGQRQLLVVLCCLILKLIYCRYRKLFSLECNPRFNYSHSTKASTLLSWVEEREYELSENISHPRAWHSYLSHSTFKCNCIESQNSFMLCKIHSLSRTRRLSGFSIRFEPVMSEFSYMCLLLFRLALQLAVTKITENSIVAAALALRTRKYSYTATACVCVDRATALAFGLGWQCLKHSFGRSQRSVTNNHFDRMVYTPELNGGWVFVKIYSHS